MQEALRLILQVSMGGHWDGEIPVSFFVAQVHLNIWEDERQEKHAYECLQNMLRKTFNQLSGNKSCWICLTCHAS